MNQRDLRNKARRLGVLVKDASKKWRNRSEIEEDCRCAMNRSSASLALRLACGLEAERTTTVPGYAGASMHTASTAANFDSQGLGSGGNALGAAVAELSALNLGQLRATVTSLGVAHRGESRRRKTRNRLEEDCRRALEDRWSKRNARDKLLQRLRRSFAHVKAKDRLGKRDPQVKEKDRLRKRDPEVKAKDRLRKRRKATREACKKRAALAGTRRAHANRKQEAVCPGGTWRAAANVIAEAEGRLPGGPEVLPPSYVGLNNPDSLRHIFQMYEFLNEPEWCTCVCCWRAWYHANLKSDQFEKILTKTGYEREWFQPHRSKILKCETAKHIDKWMLDYDIPTDNHCDAQRFLRKNYPAEVCERILDRIEDAKRKRSIVLCKSCAPFVSKEGSLRVVAHGEEASMTRLCDYTVDPVKASADVVRERWQDHTPDEVQENVAEGDPSTYILGRSISDFAPAIAALSDGEEMVLALVHPLCQVYTIPRTGQLAYVGHVCNFRQKVTEFLKQLPTLPSSMPFVKVRPRSFGGRPCMKAPFTVNVEKLYAAFVWLKKNNLYYQNVEWREDWAEEWRKDDVDIGQTRDEDMDDGESLVVNREAFGIWMRSAERERAAETHGFEMGQRLLGLLESAGDDNEESADEWNRVRSLVASVFDCSFLRAAQTVSRDHLAAMMHHYNAIDFEGISVMSAKDLRKAIGSLQPEQFPSSLELHHSEMLLACDEAADTVAVETAAALSASDASDDVGLRKAVVQDAVAAVAKVFGVGPDVDIPGPGNAGSGGASASKHEIGEASPAPGRAGRYPRVDAPEVEGSASMAIREDEPGYIPKAFPKFFPFGTSDFHTAQGGRTALGSPHRLLSFNAWGKYVMTWHDGRFMRHTRFRYWFLDTWLRSMTPTMQRVFLKTHPGAAEYTLQDLQDKAKCKDLALQMSTSTSSLPGTVGERRQMRQ